MFWGILLVLLGVVVFLQNAGVITDERVWGYLLPILLVAAGIKIMMHRRHHCWCCKDCKKGMCEECKVHRGVHADGEQK